MTPRNLLVVAPTRLFREGLRKLFEGTAFNILEEASEPEDAISVLQTGAVVDIVLIELSDESARGIWQLQSLRAAAPTARIVLLADGLNANLMMEISNSASSVLSKDVSSIALFHALELLMLHKDIISISPALTAGRSAPLRPAAIETETATLSSRETEILRYLSSGMPNKTIARELNVAETTVKAHVKMILKKTKAENRTQAAVWCIANGLNGSDQTNIGG